MSAFLMTCQTCCFFLLCRYWKLDAVRVVEEVFHRIAVGIQGNLSLLSSSLCTYEVLSDSIPQLTSKTKWVWSARVTIGRLVLRWSFIRGCTISFKMCREGGRQAGRQAGRGGGGWVGCVL